MIFLWGGCRLVNQTPGASFPRIYRKKCPESSTLQDIDPRPSCEAMDSFSRSFQWQVGGGPSFCSKTWNFSEWFKSQVWRLALLRLVRLDENLVGPSCQKCVFSLTSKFHGWCCLRRKMTFIFQKWCCSVCPEIWLFLNGTYVNIWFVE